MKIRKFRLGIYVLIPITAVVFACILAYGYKSDNVAVPPQVVELNKMEALALVQMQYQIENAVKERDEYIFGLYTKYGVSQLTHQLDIVNGRLIFSQPPEQSPVVPEEE